MLDLGLLQQVLLALDDLLQEVLVQDAVIGQIELDYYGVRNMGQGYSRCSDKYEVRSYLLLNLYLSSYAVMSTKLRFLLSICGSRSMLSLWL